MTRKTCLPLVMASLLAAFGVNTHAAESFPSRPISLVIPFPAGGTTDIVARMLGQKLGDTLKQTVIVENKPGATTLIGTQYVVRAKPDGYTLLLTGPSTFTANPAVNDKLPYDAKKDLDALGMVGFMPVILVKGTDAPYRSVADLVEQARKAPGRINYGGFGLGSITQFAGEIFNHTAGIQLTEITYKGSTPTLTDVMGGHIPISFDTVVATAPHIQAGRLHALAVTSATRSSILPDVPTMQELGFAGINVSSWLGLAAPSGLPADVRAKLMDAFTQAMTDDEFRRKLLDLGIEPMSGQTDEFVSWIDKEYQAFSDVVRIANLKNRQGQ